VTKLHSFILHVSLSHCLQKKPFAVVSRYMRRLR